MNISKGKVFNIERYTLHDGPGIRTTVFMKGCPLQCLWCSNPESQLPRAEISYFPDKCSACYRCINHCPFQALAQTVNNQPVVLAFDKCTGCGQCIDTCYPEALSLVGWDMTAAEVVAVVERDLPFYRNSGGGVTLSGGEPLLQADFARDILSLCHQKGIHTAIQTSGYVEQSALKDILPYLDLAIFDIKHLDPAEHFKLTGVDNNLILQNLAYLNSLKQKIVLQVPLIPGLNDDPDHLCSIFQLAGGLDAVTGVSLLAYHRLGVSKYYRLGREYSLKELALPDSEYLKMKKEWCKQFGIPLISFNG